MASRCDFPSFDFGFDLLDLIPIPSIPDFTLPSFDFDFDTFCPLD